MTSEYDERKRVTFEQAEGVEPLPTQLKLKEISQELRAKLWAVFHGSLNASFHHTGGYSRIIVEPWSAILLDKHVMRDHRMADEFDKFERELVPPLKRIFTDGDYGQLLGFVQWVLRHPKKPYQLEEGVQWALKTSHAAYTLVDGNTIVPIGSEGEAAAIKRAFADVEGSEFKGARTHMRNAALELTQGHYADSIRESIHAVESVARVLVPGATKMDDALAGLSRLVRLHTALRNGFAKLYGYTSDEEGIRHPLLDEPVAPVDEADALYMLGSCAAFVSYLINKARQAGLLSKGK